MSGHRAVKRLLHRSRMGALACLTSSRAMSASLAAIPALMGSISPLNAVAAHRLSNASAWAHPFKLESLPMCCTIFLQDIRIPGYDLDRLHEQSRSTAHLRNRDITALFRGALSMS